MALVDYTQDPSTGLPHLGKTASVLSSQDLSSDSIGSGGALVELNPLGDADLFVHLPWITAKLTRPNKDAEGPSYSVEVQTITKYVKGKFYRTTRDREGSGVGIGLSNTRVDNAEFYFLTYSTIYKNDQLEISGNTYAVKEIEIIPSNSNRKGYRVKLESSF